MSAVDHRGGEEIDLGRDLLAVEVAPDRRVAVVAGLAAAGADLAGWAGVTTRAAALLVALVAAGLLASGRVRTRQARLLVAAAPLFGVWLSLRASPWLVPLDAAAAGALLLAGASLSSGGSLFDLTVPRIAWRVGHGIAHVVGGPGFALASLGRHRLRHHPVLRGTALALPLLVVLGALLASADAVFASFFRVPRPGNLAVHGVLLVWGAWGASGLLRLSSAAPPPQPAGTARRRVGAVEGMTVLAGLVLLFAAFAAAQVVAASDGGQRVLRTAGLTYAEYARSGFFQLLAVAAITLVSLAALRAWVEPATPAARRRFVVLGEVAVGLTLAIVAVALRRLALYEDAFGLTMLRLYSSVFAWWIAAVFVLFGAALAGVGGRRSWLAGAAGVVALAGLLVLNVANPEAVVARHNLRRAGEIPFDPAYLADLSDDAVPTVARELPRVDPEIAGVVTDRFCARPVPRPQAGLWARNEAEQTAARARRQMCGSA